MRGKKIMLLCAAVLLALAAGAAFVRVRLAAPSQSEPIEPIETRDFMRAVLTYDEGTRTLRGTLTLTASNRTGADMESIVLRLYMNGPQDTSAAVSGVTVNGKSVSFAQDADDPTVLEIDHPFASGETVELAWTVLLKHAKTSGAAVITLPSLAMAENGAWRTDAYDALAEPSYGEAFDFMIELDGEIAAQMRAGRDASFALLPGGKVKQKEILGVRVRALAGNARTASLLLAQTQAAMESLEALGLPYPFEALTVAQAGDGREDGLALSGLIALDADGDQETLRRKITRLIARETFGVLIESDPWNAPWLSHTLASSAELLAYRRIKGIAAYEERFYGEIELATRLTRPVGVTVGGSTARFGSDSEMTQVLRDQGAAMLLGIEQAVGEDAFLAALKAYIGQNAGKIATQESLESALQAETGSSWDGYLSDGLAF